MTIHQIVAEDLRLKIHKRFYAENVNLINWRIEIMAKLMEKLDDTFYDLRISLLLGLKEMFKQRIVTDKELASFAKSLGLHTHHVHELNEFIGRYNKQNRQNLKTTAKALLRSPFWLFLFSGSVSIFLIFLLDTHRIPEELGQTKKKRSGIDSLTPNETRFADTTLSDQNSPYPDMDNAPYVLE